MSDPAREKIVGAFKGGQISQDEAITLLTKLDQKTAQPQQGKFDGLIKGVAEAAPMAGSMIGGALGAPLGPAGIVGGGALGAAGGKAVEQFLEEQVLGEQKTLGEKVPEIVQEGAADVLGGATAKGIAKAGGLLKKYSLDQAGNYLGRFKQVPRQNAEEIAAAGKRLNAPITPGLLTESKVPQNIESSLAQSPTQAASKYSAAYEDLGKILRQTPEELLSGAAKGGKTPIQLAEEAKGLISEGVEAKIKGPSEIISGIHGESKFVPVGELSTSRIAKNIESVPYAKIKGSPEHSFANQISENLRGVKTVDELRNIRGYVGKMFNDKNLSPTMKTTASEIYGKLSQLEKNAHTRAAVSIMKEAGQEAEGRVIAKEMMASLKAANKEYAAVSKNLKGLADSMKLGRVNNYADFVAKIESMPNEQIRTKLFNPQNTAALKQFEKEFPVAYGKLKQSYMVDLYNNSITKGEISLPKLFNNLKKMSPEFRSALLGKDASQTLKDVETIYNAIPGRVGPSGTPEGIAYQELSVVGAKNWWNELRDKTNKFILEHPNYFKNMGKRAKPPESIYKPKQEFLKQPARGLLNEPGTGE